MKVAIGIISYLPDDQELRNLRATRLNNLLLKCAEIFTNVPIIIVAQNWKDVTISDTFKQAKVYLYNYKDRLGITAARKKLREIFLDSEFDYLIMLDDDCELRGNHISGMGYLMDLYNNPGKFGIYRPAVMKLFAISKDMYRLVDFPDGSADDPDPNKRFFEDILIQNVLIRFYPQKQFHFHTNDLFESSDSAFDKGSTGWHNRVYNESWDRHNTGDTTRAIFKSASIDKDGKIIWNKPPKINPGTTWADKDLLELLHYKIRK